jgi:hypothetical protein
MCRVGTLRAEVHRKSLVARPIRDDTPRRVFRIPGSSTPATVHNAMFPTSASFFGRSSPIEFDDLGSDERAVGQLELRARRVGQRCHSARGPVQERAARGEGPRTASRLPAFLGSGAAARVPSLVCKQADTCVRVQAKVQALQAHSRHQEYERAPVRWRLVCESAWCSPRPS